MIQQMLANPQINNALPTFMTKVVADEVKEILRNLAKANGHTLEGKNAVSSFVGVDKMVQSVLGGVSAQDAPAILEKILLAQGVDASIIAVFKSKLATGSIQPKQVYALFQRFRGMNTQGVIEILNAVPVNQLTNITNHAHFGVIMSMWDKYKKKGRLDIKDVLLHLLELQDLKEPSPPASPTTPSPPNILWNVLGSLDSESDPDFSENSSNSDA